MIRYNIGWLDPCINLLLAIGKWSATKLMAYRQERRFGKTSATSHSRVSGGETSSMKSGYSAPARQQTACNNSNKTGVAGRDRKDINFPSILPDPPKKSLWRSSNKVSPVPMVKTDHGFSPARLQDWEKPQKIGTATATNSVFRQSPARSPARPIGKDARPSSPLLKEREKKVSTPFRANSPSFNEKIKQHVTSQENMPQRIKDRADVLRPSSPVNRSPDIQRKRSNTLPSNYNTGRLMKASSVDKINYQPVGFDKPKRSLSLDIHNTPTSSPNKQQMSLAGNILWKTQQETLVDVKSNLPASKKLSSSNPILSNNPHLSQESPQRHSFSSGYKSIGSTVHSLGSSLDSCYGIPRDKLPQKTAEVSSFRSLNNSRMSCPVYTTSPSDSWNGSISRRSINTSDNSLTVTKTIGRSTTSSITTTTAGSSMTSSETPSNCVFSILNTPLGLKNSGNMCYMNSVLQCLVHTQALTQYFLTAHEETFDKQSSLIVYQKFVKKLWQDMTASSFEPHKLRMAFRSSTFYIGSGQQDAPEFLDFFLLKLHSAMNRPETHIYTIDDSSDPDKLAVVAWSKKLSTDNSFISELFMGQLRSTLTCVKCRNASYSFDPFWSLSLPLPSSNKHKSVITVLDCLNEYTQEEKLQGDDKTFCSGCSSKQESIKTLKIQRFPKILVLHLMRFSYANGRRNTKVSTGVKFHEQLHVTSAATNNNPNDKAAMYQLYGYIDHYGTSNSGHYTATCKHISTGCWHSINDSNVSPVRGIDTSPSNTVYVLFYEKI